jgi:general secretion pathway protein D
MPTAPATLAYGCRLLSATASLAAFAATPRAAIAQRDTLVRAQGDSVIVQLVDVDLRAAIQALGRYLDRPVVIGNLGNASSNRVTLETPHAVPRGDVVRLLRGLLESQGVELVADTTAGIFRLLTRDAQRPAGVGPSASTPGGGGAGQPTELFVIRLRHAKASDVAATVNALYGRGGALGELGERPATLSRELQQNQVAPGVQQIPMSQGTPPATVAAGAVGRVAALLGEVTIVPDPRANSLLVRASRGDFTLVQAAVTELDVRPLQVLIEVLIAEVRKDRSLDYGVDASLPVTSVPGSDNTTVQATTTGIGLGDFALKVMGIGGVNVDATLRAAAARGDATIVSRPVVLAANNERAEINVGSQRPFVQVARVLPTDNTARDQVVQYKDVGTKLAVVPTISADGYVMLQVVQEVNAATAEQQFNAPIISTRSVETRLLIKNGQTIVLGGLTDRQREVSQGGVPFFSSIPWLGGLFGRASRRTTNTELFLFLTPRVIGDDADTDTLTQPLKRRAEKIGHE